MPDACAVGEAADGETALRLVLELAPDVVLMDLHLPGLSGIEVTDKITERHPDVAVVALTMLEDEGSMLAAIRAGARAYLLKGADEAEISATLRVVSAGGVVFGPDVAARALASIRAENSTRARPFAGLSQREAEVLELLARGRSNLAIASTLHLGHQTVRNYVSNIFTKLGVEDRAEAIVRARESGFSATTHDDGALRSCPSGPGVQGDSPIAIAAPGGGWPRPRPWAPGCAGCAGSGAGD